MGFLDKVKTQAEQAMKQGQDKLDDMSAKRKADGLLRDLGAWVYATRTERDGGKGRSEQDRIIGELKAHEAEHGPLGGGEDDEPEPQTPAPPGPPGPETAPVPPPTPTIPPGPGPDAPPPPGTPSPMPPPEVPPGPMPPLEVPPSPAAPPTGIPPMQAGPPGAHPIA